MENLGKSGAVAEFPLIYHKGAVLLSFRFLSLLWKLSSLPDFMFIQENHGIKIKFYNLSTFKHLQLNNLGHKSGPHLLENCCDEIPPGSKYTDIL